MRAPEKHYARTLYSPYLPHLQICVFPHWHVEKTQLRNESGSYEISFRSPLAHKFVGENANALCFETKLRNSFRSTRPIKTWTEIKKHPPTPMSLYSSIMVGGCGGMARGLSPTLSIVEAARRSGLRQVKYSSNTWFVV